MNSGEIYEVCMNELFQEFIRIRPQWEEKRIIAKRQDGIKTKIHNLTELNNRRIINEDEVVSFLESYGYVSVILDGMPLHQIISLFRTATHIIGVHGAGLTNLLFSENASVIELHAEGHGIRPDYFQLALIKRLQYCYHVFPSFNKFNDVVVDIQILQTLLDCTAQ